MAMQTYLAQTGSANSLQLPQNFSAFVAEEFVERGTIFSWNQRRTYQREITYKSADKRNDLGNVPMRNFCENISNIYHVVQ